jgi:phosphatidylglycerophosphatase A
MPFSDQLILFLAQGCGVGRIPKAPGTFGSILGIFWFFMLLLPGSWWAFVTLNFLAVVACIPICTHAERILGKSDPGSVVIDEIVAIPICFVGWLWFYLQKHGQMPRLEYFCSTSAIVATIAVFGFFRLFDIWKPWPINRIQSLSQGLGVTADDVLAAVYVNGVVGAVYALGWWPQ